MSPKGSDFKHFHGPHTVSPCRWDLWQGHGKVSNKLTILPKPSTTTIRASHFDHIPEYFVDCIGNGTQWIVASPAPLLRGISRPRGILLRADAAIAAGEG
jgi:hypothetical protein